MTSMPLAFSTTSLTGQYRSFRFFMVILIGLLLLHSLPARAVASPAIGVVYPEVREPYRSIFSTIIAGINAELKQPLKHFLLQEQGASSAELYQWIEKEQLGLIIVLGKRSQSFIEAVSVEIPVIYGALAAVSNSEIRNGPGILLIPSPESFFDRLLSYAPGTGSILVVYNAEHNQWLIERARKSARSLGIKLKAIPASNIRQAAQIWNQAILENEDKPYAIWLLHDRTVVDDRAILSMILKESWERNIIAFSSNPAHVKRGVLFSLYPDNYNMGRSLGQLALRHLSSGVTIDTLAPTEDVFEAFNTRTAEHLGIKLADDKVKEINLIFPGR
jgi:putative ABC transport system substrate-binding protein